MGRISSALGIKNMSAEDPASPLLPASAMFESLGLGRSDAGVLVNERQALRLPPAHSCVKVISEDLSRLSLDIFQQMPDGSLRIATEHRCYPLLHDRPNPNMSSQVWRNAMMASECGYGNGYSWIKRDRAARVIALVPLASDKTSPVKVLGQLMYATTQTENGQAAFIDPQHILHFMNFSLDGIVGLSPIQMCKNAIGLGIAAEKFGAQFFGNGARASGVFTHPDSLDEEARENLIKSVRERANGDNALAPMVLEEGLKWTQTTIPPNDAQFIACTVAGTLISMSDGSRKAVESLRPGDRVFGWGGGLELATVKAIGAPPRMPLVRIKTSRGRILECTLDHPVLSLMALRTPGGRAANRTPGWVPAGDLQIGNYVRTALGLPWEFTVSQPCESAYLLGALIGNGYMREASCTYSTGDVSAAAGVRAALQEIGADLKHKDGPDYDIITGGNGRASSDFRRLIQSSGLQGSHSGTKRVPLSVFRGGPVAWGNFLSGYFDADGSATKPGAKHPFAYWSSVNRELLGDCQHLLAMLGIQSGIYQMAKGGKRVIIDRECDCQPTYGLYVCDVKSLRVLSSLLHLRHNQKAANLEAIGVLPDSKYTKSNVEYDRVVSIERLGPGETIGVEIDDIHTHVTNGIVTHNTRQYQKEEIASLFRVPMHLLQSLLRSTNNNIEHQGLDYVRFCLAPRAVNFEQEVNYKIDRKSVV